LTTYVDKQDPSKFKLPISNTPIHTKSLFFLFASELVLLLFSLGGGLRGGLWGCCCGGSGGLLLFLVDVLLKVLRSERLNLLFLLGVLDSPLLLGQDDGRVTVDPVLDGLECPVALEI
jgi:hypothetical protein